MNQLSPEVIEAARKKLYWAIQGARSHVQMVRETAEAFAEYDAVVARAALTAAVGTQQRYPITWFDDQFGNSIQHSTRDRDVMILQYQCLFCPGLPKFEFELER